MLMFDILTPDKAGMVYEWSVFSSGPISTGITKTTVDATIARKPYVCDNDNY